MRTATRNINRANKRNQNRRPSRSNQQPVRNNVVKKNFIQAIASYCKVHGNRLPVYSVKMLPTRKFICRLSLPANSSCPTVKSQIHAERHLARMDAAGQACQILIQNGELDTKLRPSATLSIGRTLPSFGNVVLAAPVQYRLGLHHIPLSVLRAILIPHMDETPGNCLPALGEAFLKFFLAAYFFVSWQDETEGALTTRIQNESSKAALASYILTSGLVLNICTGLCSHKFEESVAATVFRDILGAAIVFGGLDYAIHVARSFGMTLDRTIGMKGLKVIYVLNRTFEDEFLSISTADPREIQRIQTVELALGYRFQDPHLAIEATTHESVENAASYERLELLGDAVLEYAVAEYYYHRDPSVRVNDFRRAKSRRLCNDALGTLCICLHLNQAIAVDDQEVRNGMIGNVAKVRGRMANGVRGWKQMNLIKVFGDAFEAVIGAVFVDTGFELGPVHEVLGRVLIPFIEENDV